MLPAFKIAPLCILLLCTLACKKPDSNNSKVWEEFLDNGDQSDPVLIDFSYAGFDFGESNLPSEIAFPEFNVTEYGAIADDSISDFEGIQNAIIAAEKVGGGIVAFPTGRFLLNERSNNNQSIRITSSNIVLKGEGDEKGGTELFMKEHLVVEDSLQMWSTAPMIHFVGDELETEVRAELAEDAPFGSFSLVFDEQPKLQAGDIILIRAQGLFLNKVLLKGKKTRELWRRINTEGAVVEEYYRIKSVKGKVVSLRAPLLFNLEKDKPWKIVKYRMLENCGFQNIRFVGNFLEEYVHHKNAIHDSGYKALMFTRCANSWTRNCTFQNVSSGVTNQYSLTNTVFQCKIEGNSGHESFKQSISSRCLVAYCEDNAGQWHGPGSSNASVANVILRFKGGNSGVDLHARCPRFTLFDQCEMNGLDGESVDKTSHGGAYKNLPNHLEGLVFWNFKQTGNPRPNFDFWDTLDDNPDQLYGPLTAIDPIIVGLYGISTSFNESSLGRLESLGKPVNPASLYLAQLKLRGIKTPDYLQ